jgi:hypothetical protein
VEPTTAAPSATVATTTTTAAPAAVDHFVANVTDAASFSLAAFESAMRSRYTQCTYSAFAVEDGTGYVQFDATPAGCLDVAAVAQAALGIIDLRAGYAPSDVAAADEDKKTLVYIIIGAAAGAAVLLAVTLLMFRSRGRRAPIAEDLSTKLRADSELGDYSAANINYVRTGNV